MKKISLSICFSLFVFFAFGQSGNDLKLASSPYYSYGKGLGLTSPDSLFQFNIRFRLQPRAGYHRDENGNRYFDGQIRRLRLRFDGFVGNPKFIYVMQLSFAPGDVGETTEGQNLNVIRDAMVFYRPNQHWNFGFGQAKLPGNRQTINSSGALQLPDRTINNYKFTIDRDFGFHVSYLNEKKDKFSYNVKTAVSQGDGRNWTKNPNDKLAYTAKLELFPLGAFSREGTFFEGDLAREKKPKLMLSGAYHVNHNAQREYGTYGKELYERRSMQSILIDAMFKHNGFAFQSAYMRRDARNPGTYKIVNAEKLNRTVYVGQGYDFQASYLFRNNFEIIGRYSELRPDDEISITNPDQTEYSIGVTRYVWEHVFKIQSELTYDLYNYYDNTEKSGWYVRFKVEMGI